MSNDNGFFFPSLETAAIGRPITRAGISFFPVLSDRERRPGDRHRPGTPSGSSTKSVTDPSRI